MIAKRARKPLGQRFYVTVVAGNGETLLTSEMYRDRDYAVEKGKEYAKLFKGGFVDAT